MRYFVAVAVIALAITAAARLIGDAAGRGRPATALQVAATVRPVNEDADRLEREARLALTPRPEVLSRGESLVAGALGSLQGRGR